MTEPVAPYTLTRVADEIDRLHVRHWVKRLIRLALDMDGERKPSTLTVVFHSDGRVTFFDGEARGAVDP